MLLLYIAVHKLCVTIALKDYLKFIFEGNALENSNKTGGYHAILTSTLPCTIMLHKVKELKGEGNNTRLYTAARLKLLQQFCRFDNTVILTQIQFPNSHIFRT